MKKTHWKIVAHAFLSHTRLQGVYALNHSQFFTYTRKNAQLVTNLQQTCSKLCWNNLLTGCARTGCPKLVDKLLQACSRLATSLMNSTALLQVVPTTCYRAAINNLSTSCESQTWHDLRKWQHCYKLVDKLCVFACVNLTHLLQLSARLSSTHSTDCARQN